MSRFADNERILLIMLKLITSKREIKCLFLILIIKYTGLFHLFILSQSVKKMKTNTKIQQILITMNV